MWHNYLQKNKINSIKSKILYAGIASLSFLFIFCFQLAITGTASARSISPLPQSLDDVTHFRGNNGKAYYFTVTGSTSGSVYGSGNYTDDSDLPAAAVHAGILSPGETGVVKVTILPGQDNYTGTTANSITSMNYGQWDGSYSLAADDNGDNPALDLQLNLTFFRNIPGGVYTFNITGSDSSEANVPIGTDLNLWGTNVYTDDSKIALAAVHTGVLQSGQAGVVKVTFVPSQKDYIGCTFNGVTSQAYGSWDGSYSVSSVSADAGFIPYPGTMSNPYCDLKYFNMGQYKDFLGASFYFKVTGTTNGSVWGTNIYTSDSDLHTVAVHAGILSSGETGIVKVTILPGQDKYTDSTANGVTSQAYGSWDSSYSVSIPDGDAGTLPVVSNDTASGSVGVPFTYQIKATNNPITYNVTGLPIGFSFDASTGVISGTPQLTGKFSITMVANNAGKIGAGNLILTITDSQTTTGNCATFNFLTNTMHVPCLDLGTSNYWLDLQLMPGEPLSFQLADYGTNSSSVSTANCATFDLFSNLLHIPCLNLGGSTNYWIDLQLIPGNQLLFQLTDYGIK